MSRVDELIAAGFQQVSRKYRRLARTPANKTALEALAEVAPEYARQILAHAEDRAARHFRAVHASGEDRIELSAEEFKEYLGKTGRSPEL
jgi:hypothetical protein